MTRVQCQLRRCEWGWGGLSVEIEGGYDVIVVVSARVDWQGM